jgi:hypothetical protein
MSTRPRPQRKFRHHPKLHSWWIVSAICVVTLLQANGENLVIEKFDYQVGPLSYADTGSGWLGAWTTQTPEDVLIADTWMQPTPAGYVHEITPPVLRLLSSGSKTVEVSREFQEPIILNPDEQRTHYFSAVFRRVDSADNSGTEAVRFIFNTGSRSVLTFGFDSEEMPEIAYLPSATAVTGQGRLAFTAPGERPRDYLLIGKIVANPAGTNDGFHFSFFSPDDDVSQEPELWSVSLTSLELEETLTNFMLSMRAYAENTYWDNLIFGPTYQSVISPSAP